MRTTLSCFAAIAIILLPSTGRSQPAAPPGGWTFDLTTYGWISAVTGRIGAGPNVVSVDNSFSDTLHQSDSALGFMARGELRRGQLGLFLDGLYSKLGYDDVRLGPATVDATSVVGLLEFGAAYEVANGRFGASDAHPWALDVIGGGRWTHLYNKVSLVGISTAKSTTDWVDPFVGLRLRGRLAPRWDYTLRGDVGGGIGGTRVAWQLYSTVGYSFEMFGHESTVYFGYRALSQDYESAKLVWDVTMHGPVFGLNVRF
ncbi:hypothetical protein [Paracraurococcus lichenis]|uniref:Outer membrane protein beta-barrel domain-containing protein n=1 Tax=Paracraurococcus lichenis TaxID=3064888 RepID=A0ABT9ECZ7_9PROT|nr:hypothetical protein [Paracraurococcus sp. LOR1-02]MDO9714092.1 hypothetical protein [Paracraurococcus sp. LOR1-02]